MQVKANRIIWRATLIGRWDAKISTDISAEITHQFHDGCSYFTAAIYFKDRYLVKKDINLTHTKDNLKTSEQAKQFCQDQLNTFVQSIAEITT